MCLNIHAQITDVAVYGFGHSLIDHRPPLIPTPSDETTVFHWMADIARHAEKEFSGGGQFGFLTSHADLPPMSQWGYDQVDVVWDQEFESFEDSKINTILITPANFIQYVAPSDPHPFDENSSVVSLTETIFDWTNGAKENLRYYIYGNWPEMDLEQYYPPNLPQASEIAAYHALSIDQGENWWTEYQDDMLNSRPQYQTRLIPVGMILSKVLQLDLLDALPFQEVYEDSAPHGRASLYFLSAMVSYMAMYEEKIPEGYMPSTEVHGEIRNNLAALVDFVWDELLAYNLPDGNSRVFYDMLSASFEDSEQADITLKPNPCHSTLYVSGLPNYSTLRIINPFGTKFFEQNTMEPTEQLDIRSFPEGIYYIQIFDKTNTLITVKRIVKAN